MNKITECNSLGCLPAHKSPIGRDAGREIDYSDPAPKRNEHCPPHVHVGTAKWDARFQFSFWHNSVRLWDVTPAENEPNVSVLEDLRQVIRQPAHLQRARELWWISRQTLCLENQRWDPNTQTVVSPRERRLGTLAIQSSHFDAQAYKTVLQLAGASGPVEIEL